MCLKRTIKNKELVICCIILIIMTLETYQILTIMRNSLKSQANQKELQYFHKETLEIIYKNKCRSKINQYYQMTITIKVKINP